MLTYAYAAAAGDNDGPPPANSTRTPAQSLAGTLDAYLYGDNLLDSGVGEQGG